MVKQNGTWIATIAATVTMGVLPIYSADAESIQDALTQGKVSVDVRLRYEHGDVDGMEASSALTVRPRIGYATESFHGLSGYLEFEHVQAINRGDDYNQAGTNPDAAGKTVIADVEGSEVNEAYLMAKCPDVNATVKVGRQRIKLDNHRFIGNVGWRQNEQTYDALSVSYGGIDGVRVHYSYLETINRIFGQENGTTPSGAAHNAAQFNSDSHVFNVSIDAIPPLTVAAYAYLLDLGSAAAGAANSSDTFGIRLACDHVLNDDLTVSVALEYARQSDNSATTDEASYKADYLLADVSCVVPFGQCGVGYESLGADDGVAFSTPLATLHKFNGWADVFLVTPRTGLVDLYLYAECMLPWEVTAKLVLHDFSSDEDNIDYGTEIDARLVKRVNPQLTLLAKASSYNADSDADNPRTADVLRASFEANYAF